MTSLRDKFIKILGSNKLFIAVIGLFFIQGLIFAVVVTPSIPEPQPDGYTYRGGGIVPDGNRHIAAMYYYAERPLLAGPFIDNMSDRDLWLGDLERFPSYLYQYLLSFPVRALTAAGATDNMIVLTVRLIGLLIGLAALVVFRKIAVEIGSSRAVANVAMLSLALTGSFAWLSPAENYDVMALLLFFVFMLCSLRLFTRRDSRYLYGMFVAFCLLSITKYTYIPFAGIMGLMVVWVFVRRVGWSKLKMTVSRQWTETYGRLTKWQIAGLSILLLVSGGLFAERIGVNLIQYQSFSPACTSIHSHEACMNFSVYERNYNRSILADSERAESFTFQPIEYTGFWLDRYFNSMYAYLGHIWIYDFWRGFSVIAIASTIVTLTLVFIAKRRKIRLLTSSGQWVVLSIAMIMIVAQLVFNAMSHISFAGAHYAHQGRYLMAAAGLLYIILLIVLARSLQAFSPRRRTQVTLGLTAFGLAVLVLMSPLISYWLHAWSAEWYSGPVRDILPGWWFQFREYIFYDIFNWRNN